MVHDIGHIVLAAAMPKEFGEIRRMAHDGDRPIATPYDDCVLVMPAEGCQPGQTAVRLGRVLT